MQAFFAPFSSLSDLQRNKAHIGRRLLFRNTILGISGSLRLYVELINFLEMEIIMAKEKKKKKNSELEFASGGYRIGGGIKDLPHNLGLDIKRNKLV